MRWRIAMMAAAIGGLIGGFGGAAQAADLKCGLSNGKAAAGAPIPLGGIVSITGPDNFSFSGFAAKAYFDCVNANGGVNGRPIKYDMLDDGWSPEQSSQDAAKLINDEKVVALVGNMSFVDCGANQGLYEKADVMVVAGVGVPRDCYFQKNYVTTNAGPRVSNTKTLMYLVKEFPAIKRFVCFAPNIPNVGEWSCAGAAGWIKRNGGEAKIIAFDPGSLDATSLILEAMAFKPDAISISTPKGLAVPFFSAAEEQGLIDKVHWMGPASLYNPTFPSAISKAWDGKVYVDMELKSADADTPDTANWRAVMDKYSTPDIPRDTFAQAGYLAARVVTDTLMKMDPKSIDRASVTAALRKVTRFTSDMWCAPWYIGDGPRHNPNHTGPTSILQGGKLVPQDVCIDSADPELDDIHAYEKTIGIAQ